jgi:hypothetical protein
MVSCRTGPLRVGRPLRGFFSSFGGLNASVLPLVGGCLSLWQLCWELFDLFE